MSNTKQENRKDKIHNEMQSIPNTNIHNLWTRIFYENQTLKYEISIQLKSGVSNLFQVFTNYPKYRETLDRLVRAKDTGTFIDLKSKVLRA